MTAVRSGSIAGKKYVHSAAQSPARPATGRKQPETLKTNWQSLTVERLTDELSRQVIHGEKATLAQLALKAGAGVALEDSTCFDFLAPVRENWLKGEDQYLRKLR